MWAMSYGSSTIAFEVLLYSERLPRHEINNCLYLKKLSQELLKPGKNEFFMRNR